MALPAVLTEAGQFPLRRVLIDRRLWCDRVARPHLGTANGDHGARGCADVPHTAIVDGDTAFPHRERRSRRRGRRKAGAGSRDVGPPQASSPSDGGSGSVPLRCVSIDRRLWCDRVAGPHLGTANGDHGARGCADVPHTAIVDGDTAFPDRERRSRRRGRRKAGAGSRDVGPPQASSPSDGGSGSVPLRRVLIDRRLWCGRVARPHLGTANGDHGARDCADAPQTAIVDGDTAFPHRERRSHQRGVEGRASTSGTRARSRHRHLRTAAPHVVPSPGGTAAARGAISGRHCRTRCHLGRPRRTHRHLRTASPHTASPADGAAPAGQGAMCGRG